MKDQIKRCPKCNSLVKGNVNRGMLQGAGQGFAKGIINSFTFGVGGSVLDASGALSKAGDAVREAITETTVVEFNCACGYTWQEIIGNNEENIPEELLQKEKEEALKKCQSKISSNTSRLIFFGIAFALCVWYLVVNPLVVEVQDHNWLMGDFVRTEWQWGWIGMFVLACITGFPALCCWISLDSAKKEKDELGSMSLIDFKTSPLRNKYNSK